MPDMTAKPFSSPALAALRDATREQHAELDQRSPLSDQRLDMDSYLAHAARVLGWMRPVERALWQGPVAAELPEALLSAQRNVKSQWLRRDLVEAGLSAADISAIPDCPYVPVPHSLPEALGMTYVVEGATLGGSFLLRQLADRLPQSSLAWLKGYGQDTGNRWKDFLRLLDLYVVSEADITAAAQTAQATFQSFRRWVIDEADQIQG